MVDFSKIIEHLVDIGFYRVFLPFILIYVIVFAILEKSGIFKKSDNSDIKQTKNINATIAFVFALFVVASIQTVVYIQSLIINIIIFIVFILCVLILLGFVLGDTYTELFKNKYLKWGFVITILVVTSVILLNILGFWDWFLEINFGNSEDWITGLVIIGIIGILYWITKGDDKNITDDKDKDKD